MTTTGLVLTAGACWLIAHRSYRLGFSFVLLAILLDELDGYLARRLNAESTVGAWLDTTADIFTFLIFPSIYWHQTLEVAPAVLSVLFIAGCVRLLRHAIWGYERRGDALAYTGLPSSAIQMLLGLSLAFPMSKMTVEILLISLSLAMVSTVRIPKPPPHYAVAGLVVYLMRVIGKIGSGSK